MTPEEKKTKPTNCSQCNKRIKRRSWYYHNGSYFCGKNCAKTFWNKAQEEKKAKAAEEAKAKEEAKPEPETQPKEDKASEETKS